MQYYLQIISIMTEGSLTFEGGVYFYLTLEGKKVVISQEEYELLIQALSMNSYSWSMSMYWLEGSLKMENGVYFYLDRQGMKVIISKEEYERMLLQ